MFSPSNQEAVLQMPQDCFFHHEYTHIHTHTDRFRYVHVQQIGEERNFSEGEKRIMMNDPLIPPKGTRASVARCQIFFRFRAKFLCAIFPFLISLFN